MACTPEYARRAALALPGTEEITKWGRAAWAVNGNGFASDRPLSKADIKRLGSAPTPSGDIISIATVDLDDKEAILQSGEEAFFDIEHFHGYPAYLVQLDKVSKRTLKAALLDGWLTVAPLELAKPYLR